MARGSSFAAIAALVVAIASGMHAPVWAAESAEQAASPPGASELPGLEAFVDGVIDGYMQKDKIAGVEVAIVRNGELLLLKGYGIDAVEPVQRVDPTRSLFRIGSISKTFTWLALLQLAERGQLELTDPVNQHLPDELDIPDEGFEEPIRIIDLMNHTAGFEDSIQHLFRAEGSPLLPLSQHLQKYRPHRVREPGRLMAYSNYGSALAGAIVASVSGMPFEDYIERNILEPLGMTSTTFRESYPPAPDLPAPMSEELARRRAENIEWRQGAWQAIAHEHIVSMAPAGSAVSTAADMARYMIALLDPEVMAGAGVLRADTVMRLREPTFQSAPGMPAVHHGFFNLPLGTTRPVGFDNLSHNGATLHFTSLMTVIPDLTVAPVFEEPGEGEDTATDALMAQQEGLVSGGTLGIFVTTNSSLGMRLAMQLPEHLLTRYFAGAGRGARSAAVDDRAPVQQYVGQYRSARRSYTKLEKILSLASLPISVSTEGELVAAILGEPARFVPIGEDLVRQTNGDVTLAFLRDEDGRITHVVTPGGAMARIGFFQSLPWLILILVAGLITSVGIVIGALLSRHRAPPSSVWEVRSRWVMIVMAVVWLAALALLAVWAISFAGPDGIDRFIYTYPDGLLKVALGVLLVAVGLTLLSIGTLVPAWRTPGWSLFRRVRHSIAIVILLALVLTLMQWNLVGFRYF
jgi:CubicO group peptidase (beta-lactamase class C family)